MTKYENRILALLGGLFILSLASLEILTLHAAWVL